MCCECVLFHLATWLGNKIKLLDSEEVRAVNAVLKCLITLTPDGPRTFYKIFRLLKKTRNCRCYSSFFFFVRRECDRCSSRHLRESRHCERANRFDVYVYTRRGFN